MDILQVIMENLDFFDLNVCIDVIGVVNEFLSIYELGKKV